MPAWLIPLIFELLKLLPKVIEWVKAHPLADRREVVAQFPGEVKGLIEKLKKRREERQGIGSPPDLVG